MNLFLGMALGVILATVLRHAIDTYFDRPPPDCPCPGPPSIDDAALLSLVDFWGNASETLVAEIVSVSAETQMAQNSQIRELCAELESDPNLDTRF